MNRRRFLSAAAAVMPVAYGVQAKQSPSMRLYSEDWFHKSSLDLSSDLKAAAADGKGLIVLVEQINCGYCRDLHQVNFADAELVDYMFSNFVTVQLNLFGSREVTDFDGVILEESALANKWGVNFTPSAIIFPAEAAESKSRAAGEAFRLPGYLKPFHYRCGLEFVAKDIYKEKAFQEFVQEKYADLKAMGKAPDIY